MAITTFDTLAAEIKAWAANSSAAFSNRIETFVRFTEDRIYNGQGHMGDALYCPPLRAPEMEVSSPLTFVAGAAVKPDDMNTLRVLRRLGDDTGLDYLTPKQFWIRDAQPDGTTSPAYYTVEGSTIRVTPSYDGDLEILYFKTFTPLSVDNPANDLVTKYPMLYLSGCLFEAFSYLQEPDLAAGHWERYKSQVSGINQSIASTRFGGGPLAIRVRNPIP